MQDVPPISKHKQLVVWTPVEPSVDFAMLGRKLVKIGRTALLIWGGVSLLGVGAYGFGAIGGAASPEPGAAAASAGGVPHVAVAATTRTANPDVAPAKPVNLPAASLAPVKVASKPAPISAPVQFVDEEELAVAPVQPEEPVSSAMPVQQPEMAAPVALPVKRPPLPVPPQDLAEETSPTEGEVTVARLPRPRPEAPIITGSLRDRVATDSRRRRHILRFGPPLDYYRYARRAPRYYPGPEFPFYER